MSELVFPPVSALRAKPANVVALHDQDWTRITRAPTPQELGAFPDLAGHIWFVNHHVHAHRHSHFDDPTGGPVAAPQGLHVLASPPEAVALLPAATREMEALFEQETKPSGKHSMWLDHKQPVPGLVFLFYSYKEGAVLPMFTESYNMLLKRQPVLAKLCLTYASAIRNIIGADNGDISGAALSLLRYEPGVGLRRHIDNVEHLGGTLGPIFNVSLGRGTKVMDMYPVITSEELQPLRVSVEQGDIIVMDESARTEWCHAIPEGNPNTMYTLGIKFGRVPTVALAGHSEVLNTPFFRQVEVPQAPATGLFPHNHGPRPGKGVAHAEAYTTTLRVFLADKISNWEGFGLALDDEDVRYTMDVAPGIMSKLKAAELVPGSSLVFWDLFCSPGLDLLYALLLPVLSHRQVTAVGVAAVSSDNLRARFQRLEQNMSSLADLLRQNRCPPPNFTLHKDNAEHFCRTTDEPAPDVLWLSPFWMTSNGDMTRRGAGRYVPWRDTATKLGALVRALVERSKGPMVIVSVMPYSKQLVFPGYAMQEVIQVHKRWVQSKELICDYFVHVHVRGDRRPGPAQSDFTFYK